MVRACIAAAAKDAGAFTAIGVYFELWLLRLAGYLPDWTRCDQCLRALNNSEEVNVQANFHLLCSDCRRAASNRVIGPVGRSMVSEALRLAPAAFVQAAKARKGELDSLSNILKDLISHSIGREISAEVSLATPAATQT